MTDNEQWTKLLRGDYSRTVPGESTRKTLHLIDFLHPQNNTLTVTNQLYVKSQKSHIPDVVVFVNGIPLVVIEAKSPVSGKDKSGQAFEQIKQHEQDIPRLSYSNLLSIVTVGVHFYYGTTGAPLQHWSAWNDPWPKADKNFVSTEGDSSFNPKPEAMAVCGSNNMGQGSICRDLWSKPARPPIHSLRPAL